MAAILLTPAGAASAETEWNLYSHLDTFAYSEPVSIKSFVKDFDDDLEGGDTAFTHDSFEFGVRWNNLTIAAVQRFDYVTSFTPDTALYHHTTKNGGVINQNRDYDLLLDVERVTAAGLKVGYSHRITSQLKVSGAISYYTSLSSLQSGFAGVAGDLEPLTDQLIQEATAITDNLSADNRDLSPLKDLVSDILTAVNINFAYDDPKFGEPFYRKPVITGQPNPVISGVDFDAPDGTGYAIDAAVEWQPTEQLTLGLKLWDIANQFNWDNAPVSVASFDLNPFLLDAIDVTQLFVDGEVVTPNDLVDRHLLVTIQNQDVTQKLPWRGDLSAAYLLDFEPAMFGWQPSLAITGGYYRTGTQNFPRVGVILDDRLHLDYDLTAEAISVAWTGKYLQARIISDKFNLSDAKTLGLSLGFNLTF